MDANKIREVIPDTVSRLRQAAEKVIEVRELFKRLHEEIHGPAGEKLDTVDIQKPEPRGPTQIEEMERLSILINDRLNSVLDTMRCDLNTLLGDR